MELPSVATAHADISYQPRLDNVVKCLHSLLDRSIGVEPVALENVDVVQAETFERFLDTSEDVLAVKSTTVD